MTAWTLNVTTIPVRAITNEWTIGKSSNGFVFNCHWFKF